MSQEELRYLPQLFINLGQGCLKSGTAMRIRSALIEDLFALQLQGLALSLLLCGLYRCLLRALRWTLAVRLPLRKLFLNRFALPTSRHTLMLMPIPVHP